MRILLLIGLLLIANPALAETGQELVEKAAEFDGKQVEMQGEVIGDVMVRGEYAWINVNDGTRTIGIWVKKGLVENITYVGDYNHLGDMVKFSGVFHRACRQHGGDLDVHAAKLEIAQEGDLVDHPVSPYKIAAAVLLFVLTLGSHLFFVAKKRFKF
ncbi:DNA-binding protein [Candidatus Margulisiibacteriota bacterium]